MLVVSLVVLLRKKASDDLTRMRRKKEMQKEMQKVKKNYVHVDWSRVDPLVIAIELRFFVTVSY